MPTTVVSIPGIHCEGCAKLIKDVSADVPSVTHVDVDLATKKVTIEHGAEFDLRKWTEEIQALNPKYIVQPA